MNIINDNLEVTSISASTYHNLPTQEVVVYVVNNITLPQQTIYNTTAIITPQPNQKVEYVNNYIQPKPRVINVALQGIYSRMCGSSSPNSKYVNCIQCVDKWLNNNPDKRSPLDLTSSNTGCRYGMK